jgi:hypothetical protein
MGARHARLSEILWYGLATGITFTGILAFKPRYYLGLATVERI